MTNTPLYALTPIDQTEGLKNGWYRLCSNNGVQFGKCRFCDGHWVGINKMSNTTHYLRPLPAGTEVLQPGMVTVSLATLQEVKKTFSDYVKSEGCSCCRDIDAHDEAALRMGELLGFEKYEDGSGYNFF